MMIKNFFKLIAIVGVLSLSIGFVESSQAAPGTLKATMSQMNSILKKLVTQAGDVTQNSSSAQISDEFVALSENCRKFIPKKLQNLPPDQQSAQIQDYGIDVDNMTALGKNMASAFRSDDNAGAQKILNDLSNVKKVGHSKYK